MFSLLRPLNRSLSTKSAWDKAIAPYWKQKQSFKETVRSLKEIAEKSSDITELGRYCAFLYSNHQWFEIYQTNSRIQKLADSSFIPYIFDSLYQIVNKNDKSMAEVLLNAADNKQFRPIEDRCLALLLDKMGLYEKALDRLNRYLESEEASRDILALMEKPSLELACKRPDKALVTSNLLLSLIPDNTKARLAKIDALEELKRKSNAIIELSILMGASSDPTFKAKLYKRRANLRTNKELNEKLGDFAMSDKLCPELAGRTEMYKLLFKEQKLDILHEMFKNTVTEKEISENFEIAIIKGDLCRALDKDFKKALEIYKRVQATAPPKIQARVNARIEILEEKLKHDKHND